MGDVDQTLTPPTQPTTSVAPETPVEQTPLPPHEPTSPTAQQIRQQANQTTAPIDPEVLLTNFLAGQAIEVHPPIDVRVAPMLINKTDNGGVIITPSGELLVKYK